MKKLSELTRNRPSIPMKVVKKCENHQYILTNRHERIYTCKTCGQTTSR